MGGKVEVGDFGARGLCPAPNFVFGADVVDVDSLVLVEEEDAAAGGVNDLLDLVFAEVGVKARFLVEAVGFVDNQGIECIGSTSYEGPRTFEERPVAGFGEGACGSGELAFVDVARGGVLGDVCRVIPFGERRDKEVDGHHGFAGAWSAPNDEYLLGGGGVRLAVADGGHGELEGDFLFVEKDELALFFEQCDEAVGQRLGGADAAVVDFVHEDAVVPGLDKVLQKSAQVRHVLLQEDRCLLRVDGVALVEHGRPVGAVVQERARLEVDAFEFHRFVESVEVLCVRPGLVAGMRSGADAAAKKGLNQPVLGGHRHLTPLLEFDDDDVGLSVGVVARKDEVDALGAHRQLAFDAHAGVLGNRRPPQGGCHPH